MTARESLDPDGSLWDLIAVELRRQRELHKMSGTTLGNLLDLDRSSVSRLESGGIKLGEKHAKLLDKEWSTDGLLFRLVRFAKAGHDVEWFVAHMDYESRSSNLKIWELSWIPGLFQTEDYARAIFTAAGLEDVDGFVTARLKRQECLTRRPWPILLVILDQGVIDQPVGTPEIMRQQLARLLELARQPNILLRVVPRYVGAHVGRDGSFKIMTVDGRDMAYADAYGAGRLIQDSTEIRSYGVGFDRIGSVALPVDSSVSLIKQVMEKMT